MDFKAFQFTLDVIYYLTTFENDDLGVVKPPRPKRAKARLNSALSEVFQKPSVSI